MEEEWMPHLKDIPELPGFQTPPHPYFDDRIYAQHDGEVIIVLNDHFPLGERMPDYQIWLSSEYGRMILKQLDARTGQVTVTRNNDHTVTHTFKLQPNVAQVYPGTYRLRALVGYDEVFNKSLTVLNHPALP